MLVLQVAYLEADGSGCQLWEEAELQAAGEVLAGARSKSARGQGRGEPLLVGSVKSNVGHTDGCAGMLAVAKLILAMETGVIPATINHSQPNPNLTAVVDGRVKVSSGECSASCDRTRSVAATSHT